MIIGLAAALILGTSNAGRGDADPLTVCIDAALGAAIQAKAALTSATAQLKIQ